MLVNTLTLRATSLPWEAAEPFDILCATQGQPRWAWFTPSQILVAWGISATIQAENTAALIPQLAALRSRLEVADEAFPLLFGGLSFDPQKNSLPLWEGFPSAEFILPRYIFRQQHGQSRLTAITTGEQPPIYPVLPVVKRGKSLLPGEMQETMSFKQWYTMIMAAKEAIYQGEVEKIVLSRMRKIRFSEPPDPVYTLETLRQRYPGTHQFLTGPRRKRWPAPTGAASKLWRWPAPRNAARHRGKTRTWPRRYTPATKNGTNTPSSSKTSARACNRSSANCTSPRRRAYEG